MTRPHIFLLLLLAGCDNPAPEAGIKTSDRVCVIYAYNYTCGTYAGESENGCSLLDVTEAGRIEACNEITRQ